MNKKIENKTNVQTRGNSNNFVRILSFQHHVKVNKIFEYSLAFGMIVLVLGGLYFVQDLAYAQTESNSSLIVAKGSSLDGSVHITITSTPIIADQPLALQVSFTDAQGKPIPYQHYGIKAQQMEGNGIFILSNNTAFAVNGTDIQVTDYLQNISPVNLQIQLQGSGPPGTSITNWKGSNDIVSITMGQQYSTSTAVPSAPERAQQTVTIPYGAFDPNFNTAAPQWYLPTVSVIQVNQTISWVNQDTEGHTVTSGKAGGREGMVQNNMGKPNGLFDSGTIKPGQSWSYTFTKPGEYEYFCTIHPWMDGYVIVNAKEPDVIDANGNKITKFPEIRLTQDRRYEADLSWEPHYITTGHKVTFVYQFYDNVVPHPIPAHYIFTITQNGKQLYRADDRTQFGGGYRYFVFDNPGPVYFKFDDIDGTGQSVQYSTIVNEPDSNSSQMTEMDDSIIQPARNMELHDYLIPLFFTPALATAAGLVIILQIRKRRRKT